MSRFITWRVYRDRASAPVPVLRAAGRPESRYQYAPSSVPPGETALVGAFDEAYGLYTGRSWGPGESLPAADLAREPIILYEGETRRMARPEGFAGEGPCPYLTAQVRFTDEGAVLFYPAEALARPVLARGGSRSRRLYQAAALGRGAYQIPAGYPGPIISVQVNSARSASVLDYDPYHGTLLIEGAGEAAHVQVDLDVQTSFNYALSALAPATYPVYAGDVGLRIGAPGDEPDFETIIGHLIVEPARRMLDTRRRAGTGLAASVEDPSRYHRVGYGQLDGSPLSTSHLWIIETSAPPELLEDAVERTMPAGTIYRLAQPASPAAVAIDGPFLSTEDKQPLAAEDGTPLAP